jgi:hypothetical protein
METSKFGEIQRFKIRWAWLAVISLNIVLIYAIVQQVIIGKAFGSKSAPDYVLIIIEFGLFLLLLFLFSIRLKTKITDTGIYYRFYPFQFKETKIDWHELRDAYIRQYNSFHEYGGWGIRKGGKNTGNAINTSASSNKGLQLEFNDGKLLLIGTTRPGELKLIIDAVIESGKINRRI